MAEFSQAHDDRRREGVTRQPLRIKRVYQAPDPGDGVRVLVDRLWPRGLSRERAQIDLWLKEIAPSDALRRRFHGDPAGWEEFKTAYYAELEQPPAQSAGQIQPERARTYLTARGSTSLLIQRPACPWTTLEASTTTHRLSGSSFRRGLPVKSVWHKGTGMTSIIPFSLAESPYSIIPQLTPRRN